MDFNSTIRKAKLTDLLQVFRLEKEAFAPDYYPLFVLRQLFDTAPDLFYVAVDAEDQVLGYCFGGINAKDAIGWIYALAVIKKAQQQNIGRELTTALIRAYKNKNITTIKLTTTPDNLPAIGLYEKLGFKTISEEKNYYLDHSPRIVMKLEHTSFQNQ